ncbi:MAG: cytoplasmic protein [Thermodesulfobacteriota bacterium]|nr:cytoplasmic protein [Thermodesulfobacteriota bacterium]
MLRNTPHRRPANREADFKELEATYLYCPTCNQAMPVRKRLLLVLPSGDKYEYLCAKCGTTVGEKTSKSSFNQTGLIV